MKKYFLILCLFITFKSFAQPAPGSYVSNSNLDKFVGYWQWTSGNDTFRICLQKQVVHANTLNYNYDYIVGWHRYVKNGVLVETSLQYLGRAFKSNLSTLSGTTLTPNKLMCNSFREISTKKLGRSIIRYISPTQIKWDLKGIGIGGVPGVAFKIPTNITLTKLNIPVPPPLPED